MSAQSRNGNLIEVRYFLIDHYLDNLKRKLNYGRRTSLFELYLFLSYFVLIILTIVCLFVNDLDIRLLLFDITLFIGGIRLYNSLLFILISMFGATMFMYLHFTNNHKLLKWTEPLEVFRGNIVAERVPLLRNCLDYLIPIRFAVNIFYKLSGLIFSTFGKLDNNGYLNSLSKFHDFV